MASYTPITLPYYAPAHELPEHLPTHEEVMSSEEYLASPIYGKKVTLVRVGRHYVAKYGALVQSIEGENMLFVAQRTSIPVPKVYAIYTYSTRENGIENMIIMEFIEGQTFYRSKGSLPNSKISLVVRQLRAQLEELRSILSPGYYGAIGRRPLVNLVADRQLAPCDTFQEFTEQCLDIVFRKRMGERFTNAKKFYKACLESVATGKGHEKPVFSHGDIHQENVIITPAGNPVLIDWEAAGFWPFYHEWFIADEDMAPSNFLDPCPSELRVMLDAERAFHRAESEERDSEASRSDSTGENNSTDDSNVSSGARSYDDMMISNP
ncbi:kinase-like domain-containing protein [Astrocystis sublimbata]|nr:kinase-like domain-containing protein [Astrocystis sublimbata]